MYKLSIIIPIYNVEKYIQECLKSVLDQLPRNVEVICIDDGSPDYSLALAKELVKSYSAEKQKQILFVQQKNKGLSGARNTGLTLAKGKYIGFLDSDDKLSKNYFTEILPLLKKDIYDIIDFNLITSEHEIIYTSKGSFDSVFSISRWYCPARVFKASLIKEFKFTEGIYYEDVDLTPKLYLAASKTAHINRELYWYRTNVDSITQSFSYENNLKTINSLEKILQSYLSLYTSTGNNYYAIVSLHCFFSLCINANIRFDTKKSLNYIKKYNKNMHTINIDSLPIDKTSFDHKITLFLKAPRTYISLYKIYYSMRKLKEHL